MPGSFYLKEDLLKKMDELSIDQALVYHALAKEYDPRTGNEFLQNELAGETRLHPVWAVLPHYTGEFDPPDVLMQKMREQGIKAVTLFPAPSVQNFSLSELNCGSLFQMLETWQIPLLIGFDQLGGSMQAFAGLVAAHPNLPIVLTQVNYRIDRDLYPLMDRYEHFYLETSGYKVFEGISRLCRRFGAHRLLFGTGMPQTSGAAAVGLLRYADISDAEKQMIAADNLIRLLGGVRL
ncbi:MAG: amidohydrolase family protein [Clostridiaceae bacterium]|nr:amidohydrolase family protein [Clostridiaceae bacterium]